MAQEKMIDVAQDQPINNACCTWSQPIIIHGASPWSQP